MIAFGKVHCAWIVLLAPPSFANMLGPQDGKEVWYRLKADVPKFIWL